MDTNNKESVPPEIRVTKTLLLDTEKKIEELRTQLNSLGKAESPTLNLNPPVASTYNRQNTPIANQKADIHFKIGDLKNRSLQIVAEIEKGSSSETSQRVTRLKQDWLKDLEPTKAGETKSLFESQKWANRKLNKDWLALEQPEETQTPLQQNKEDIGSRKASYMDKARGLQEDYAYLEKDGEEKGLGKEEDLPKSAQRELEEPEIDIDKE